MGVTINSTSYVNNASQDYMYIGFDTCGVGIQQGVGGFATLNSFNPTGNDEILRCRWNGSTLGTSLGMGTSTLTCGHVNATTGTFSGAVSCTI